MTRYAICIRRNVHLILLQIEGQIFVSWLRRHYLPTAWHGTPSKSCSGVSHKSSCFPDKDRSPIQAPAPRGPISVRPTLKSYLRLWGIAGGGSVGIVGCLFLLRPLPIRRATVKSSDSGLTLSEAINLPAASLIYAIV